MQASYKPYHGTTCSEKPDLNHAAVRRRKCQLISGGLRAKKFNKVQLLPKNNIARRRPDGLAA